MPITQVPIVGSPSYYPSNGQILFAAPPIYSARPLIQAPFPEGCYNSHPTPFPHPAPPAHHSYVPGLQVIQHPPDHSTYIPNRLEHSHKEVPGLEQRCGSNSSVECAPDRFYHRSLAHPDQSSSHMIAVDRPPLRPTPSQLPGPTKVHQSSKTAKTDTRIPIDVDIDALLIQAPSIPPGVLTTRSNWNLDQSLSNPIDGNRNVYICGLHPTTDHDTLTAYARRFGRIETCKVIIDISTGACQGFGFAKYFNVQCSELCIRGFHKLGYKVGFAKDSLNARLKAKGDELSTNLYVSNLPMNITKSGLCAIFKGYKVISSKICPSTSSYSSGVETLLIRLCGFESRKDCDEIIKKFHGRPICGGGHSLQVRYADTSAQKDLKSVTFQARKHNVSAYRGDTSSPPPASASPTLRRTESAHQLSRSSSHSGSNLQR
ncbi:uncharacterized protein LY89DRAFT_601477 [Mollisia scopiformis]|uniref:RRM domain-containing protein n=1 Tax=Mollisia scopiformis TaxID=149040 RepID=A0A132B549_MOLSC|nr:uncharacterized protein LY89DRAFT_601477 [Mollisia scopiformis]KUJ07373.1 hypothetical protein LY89DRAFT_601477 [Mollisia scopiformis]